MVIFGFESYGGPSAARFIEVDESAPQPGHVLIEVEATAVNPGDIKVRSGQRQGAFPVAFPMAMGREAAGRVVAAPDGAFPPGTRVFGAAAAGFGTFAPRALLAAESVAEVPEGVSSAAAACVPVAVGTAYDALADLHLQRGQTLLVLGAGGGVGTAALQLAHSAGAHTVGVASESKRDVVEAAGAVFVRSGPGWPQRALAAAGIPDAVLDLVGGEALTAGAALGSDTRPAGAGDAIPFAQALRDMRLISAADPERAAQLGGSGIRRRRSAEVYAKLAALLASGALEVSIGRRFHFSQADRAVAAVEGGHAAGKVVVYM
ncbi:zinc-binding dehydrogenase [Brevibacterium sp. BRM-1]|uniref:zinc-binding dehydrogenase n=1 Tax=Brevibacterium sp. BRM-1 TaxID=2999062 RepID=UPI00228279CC|nr:zinc-binding dehydrogenase [Brevibacterium sp. BRM-1]WAL39291.1 zinc-binding dehydrogenase [Brevibacterium sp. BRM-1]